MLKDRVFCLGCRRMVFSKDYDDKKDRCSKCVSNMNWGKK